MSLDFSARELALLGLSLAGAAGYGALLRYPPSALRSLAKTAAIGALAALSAVEGGPWLLTLGLVLSALGDLALSRDGDRAFMAGLVAFLLAHLAFIPLLLGVAEAPGARWALLSLVALAAGAAALRALWPALGEMRGPVLVYGAALLAMALSGFAAPDRLWPLPLGAALFLASDAVLALDRFLWRGGRRFAADFVWGSYYAAMAMIAGGFLCPHFA